MSLVLLDHPLARHLVQVLRRVDTEPAEFRNVSRTLSTLLVYEATRSLRTRRETIQTPLETTDATVLDQGLAVVPVLRAGLAMLESALALFPDVAVGYIGLERDHTTAVAHSYYRKLPRLENRLTLCCDPMLATGGSAAQAISLLKAAGAKDLKLVCVVAAPEGVRRVHEEHPEVPIVAAALDRGLNDLKYILPGLGDFGDRLYGTL